MSVPVVRGQTPEGFKISTTYLRPHIPARTHMVPYPTLHDDRCRGTNPLPPYNPENWKISLYVTPESPFET